MASLPPLRNAHNLTDPGITQSRVQGKVTDSRFHPEKVSQPGSGPAQSSSNDSQFKPLISTTAVTGKNGSTDKTSPQTSGKGNQYSAEGSQEVGNISEPKQYYTLQTLSAFAGMIVERIQGEPLSHAGVPKIGGVAEMPRSVSKVGELELSDGGTSESAKPLRPGSRLNLKA